jgi:hypothetical protein
MKRLRHLSLIVVAMITVSCSNKDASITGSWECTNCKAVDYKFDSLIITKNDDNNFMMQHIEPDISRNFFGGISGQFNEHAYNINSGGLLIKDNILELNTNPPERFTIDKSKNLFGINCQKVLN